MTKEVGTLREIGARVGDVVWYTFGGKGSPARYGPIEEGWLDMALQWEEAILPYWKIISRATKPFNTLTAEEKGELLLANHEGKIIEMSLDGGETWERSYTPQWIGAACYRVKADEVKEVVIYSMSDLTTWLDKEYGLDTHRITFNLVNGKPDCASVKMEEI